MATVAKLQRRPGRPTGDTGLKLDIVCAAEAAFAFHGFDAASVRQIANAAGISPAGALHHYGTKRKLYAEALRRISESLETHPVLSHPTGPGEDSLHRIIDAMVDWILENDLYARIILREIMENDERVQSAHQLPLREGMQVVYRAVRTAIDADPEDQISELLSLQLLGAAFLFYTGQPTHRSQAAVSVVGWEESFRALLKQTAACAIKVAKTSIRPSVDGGVVCRAADSVAMGTKRKWCLFLQMGA